MADAAIIGSSCTGHDGFPPRPAVTGQSKFLLFGVPIHCTGDAWSLHAKPDNPPHGGAGIGGSNFMVFGKAACRVGDAVTCGSAIATGQARFQIK